MWREDRQCRTQTLHCHSSGFCRGCCWFMAAGHTGAFPCSCATSCLRPVALLLCTYGLVSSMASVLRSGICELKSMTLSSKSNNERKTNRHLVFILLSVPHLQSMYESWFIAFYTVFYTAFPVICMAFFEQVRLRFLLPE